MKKKRLAVFMGGMAISIAGALFARQQVIKIKESELVATCNALGAEKTLNGIEEAIRIKYPQAGQKTVASSTEIAPGEWRADSWRIIIGPEGVAETRIGPLWIILSQWNQVEISEIPREKNIERGYALQMYIGKYGFMRVSSRKSPVDTNCTIEKISFINWHY